MEIVTKFAESYTDIPPEGHNITWNPIEKGWNYDIAVPIETTEPNMTNPQTTTTLSEDDMARIPALFQGIANAVVAASIYPKQIADLEAKVNILSGDLEATRGSNKALQEALDRVCTERDEARNDHRLARERIMELEADVSSLQGHRDNLQDTVRILNDQLAEVREERDQYGLKTLALEEEIETLRGKLAQAQNFIKGALSAIGVEAPAPEPKLEAPVTSTSPEAAKLVEVMHEYQLPTPSVSEPEPAPEPEVSSGYVEFSDTSNPAPEPEVPAEAPSLRRVYEGDEPYTAFWSRPASDIKQDPETGRNYYEVAA